VLRERLYPDDFAERVNENIEARGFSKVSKETFGVYVGFVEEMEETWDRALFGGRSKEEECIGVGGREDPRDCGDWVVYSEGEVGLEVCFSALRRRTWLCACSLSMV